MDQDNLNKNNSASQNPASDGLTDLPPLPEAEDETFSPPPPPPPTKDKIGGDSPLPPLPDEPTGSSTQEGSDQNVATQAAKTVGDKPTEDHLKFASGQVPGAVTPPGSIGDSSATTVEVIGGDDKKIKKNGLNKKTIIGGVIALVLLTGVPLVAFNIDRFRGDTRSSAKSCTEGYIGTTGGCVNGKTERIYRFANCETETRADGPACTTSSKRYTPSPTSTPVTTKDTDDDTKDTGSGTGGATCREDCIAAGGGGYACSYLPSCDGSGGGSPTCYDECINAGNTPIECKGYPSCDKTPTTPTPTTTGSGGGGTTTTSSSSGGGGLPVDTGMCVETRIYTLQNGAWKLTPADQVGQFVSVGDKIRLAVRGNSSQFSRGRFRVNNGTWVTTTTKNAAGEFYIEYTLSQAGTYTVEGQVQ